MTGGNGSGVGVTTLLVLFSFSQDVMINNPPKVTTNRSNVVEKGNLFMAL